MKRQLGRIFIKAGRWMLRRGVKMRGPLTDDEKKRMFDIMHDPKGLLRHIADAYAREG